VISKPFNQNQIVKFYLIVITVLLFTATSSLAQVTFTNDEATFNANNPGLALQDFESGNVAPNSVMQCSAVVNENTSDGCFSPGDILPGIEFAQVPLGAHTLFIAGPGVEGNTFVVLFTDFNTDAMDITFPGNSVNTAGLVLGCLSEGPSCSDTLIISVFGTGDELIGSTQRAVTGQFDTFVGIRSSELVTRINVASLPGKGFESLGRISFGFRVANAIPTLSEWGMIVAAGGLVLVGALFMVYRRRAVRV